MYFAQCYWDLGEETNLALVWLEMNCTEERVCRQNEKCEGEWQRQRCRQRRGCGREGETLSAMTSKAEDDKWHVKTNKTLGRKGRKCFCHDNRPTSWEKKIYCDFPYDS